MSDVYFLQEAIAETADEFKMHKMRDSYMNPSGGLLAVQSALSVTTDQCSLSLSIAPKTSQIAVAASVVLTASFAHNSGLSAESSPNELIWSSSDTSIATVDQAGSVLGRKSGSVVIAVHGRGRTDKATVVVLGGALPAIVATSVDQHVSIDMGANIGTVDWIQRTVNLDLQYPDSAPHDGFVVQAFESHDNNPWTLVDGGHTGVDTPHVTAWFSFYHSPTKNGIPVGDVAGRFGWHGNIMDPNVVLTIWNLTGDVIASVTVPTTPP